MERWKVRKAIISARPVMPGVGDVVESRRGEIAGIIVSIDAMALCAVNLSKPTTLSGTADLLRV
jgi:hypothetical protein